MSRLHIHIAVDDLQHNINFYSAMFGASPTVLKTDYAKWQLEDPKVNFAISSRGRKAGLDHVGIQADTADELAAIEARLQQADLPGKAQIGTTCCYAKSDKYWTVDPQGIAWEAFHTLGGAALFTETAPMESGSACCAPKHSSCC